jgi:transmembrane sensor
MNEIEIRVVDLIEKHLNGELSDAERQELESWKNQLESNRRIFRHLTDNSQLKHSISDSYPDERKERILATIHAKIEADESAVAKVRMMTIRKLMSAAAIIGVIACIAYFSLHVQKPQPVAETQIPSGTSDQAPGRDGAILKLSNGQEIVLDNAANGDLVKQGSTSIIKNGSVLVYNGKKEGAEVLYNTLSTPVGRQFQLVLPDGTRVWLNSSSSITYATLFKGNERNVIVSGEAYFEVAKDVKKPFKVHIAGALKGMGETVIQVLGTHFNINAYGDETPVKATLLEGSVSVKTGNNSALLKPGQQALVETTQINLNRDVDVVKEVAWKNGLFNFNNEKLKSIMPQISRWYNIDVVYENKDVQNILITGEIERKANLSEVLKILTFLNIDYKLEGRKLILKG